MRIATLALFFTLFATGISAQSMEGCPAPGKPSLRTTLYFGMKRPSGLVTESQWRKFLKTQVTPRLPAGFTVFDAAGQWRDSGGAIRQERSKVLVVITALPENGDSPALAAVVSTIVESYKKRFDQRSVLWETSRVCASF